MTSYKQFLTVRVVGGILVALVVLWGLWAILGIFEKEETPQVLFVEEGKPTHGAVETIPVHGAKEAEPMQGAKEAEPMHGAKKDEPAHGEKTAEVKAHPSGAPSAHKPAQEASHGMPEHATPHEQKTAGVAFVEGIIAPMDYELNQRFWGWRRNDILRLTDNVENIQLGVLEVVRRASVVLAERISRYGPTDAIDKNLENAMNWFMIKPDQFWLPSPEDRYNDGLRELNAYAHKLEKGEGRFYMRPDNLIPLLDSFAELLGSCDENLLKKKEEDGSAVSWFKVDDYLYYAKGVAKAMGMILHAVEQDFAMVLETRHGRDLLEHAVHACHVASELDPLLVTDSALDGILANHRANMAGPISHARHYLDILAKTLST